MNCATNQLTGFYMMAKVAFNGLRNAFYKDISQTDLLKINSSSSEIFRFLKGHFQKHDLICVWNNPKMPQMLSLRQLLDISSTIQTKVKNLGDSLFHLLLPIIVKTAHQYLMKTRRLCWKQCFSHFRSKVMHKKVTFF